jgi:hypothetical protein
MTDRLDFCLGECEDWSLLVAGDCYLDPDARDIDDPLLTTTLQDRVASADCAVVNLEAPIRSPGTTAIPKSGPALANDPNAQPHLVSAGFDMATFANNHAMDYGWESLRETMADCEKAGLAVCGAGQNRHRALTPATFEVAETRVAVINVCEREFGVARDDCPGTAWSGHPDAVRRVRKAVDAYDTVVLITHGGVEYVPFPSPERRDRLHEFADAGADLIVAHHPHVPQGWEEYDGTPIFHSLGNFVFDSMNDDRATSWGLVIEIAFSSSDPIGADLVPIAVVNGVIHPLCETDHRDRADHLAYLHRLADITAEDLAAHWQAVAVDAFRRTYSSWLLTGLGDDEDTLTTARENMYDPAVHADLWDASDDDRRNEMLVMLNILRYEGHRQVMTDALAVLTDETADKRTPAVRATVDELLDWTRRE